MCGISIVINGHAHEAITMGNAIKHRGNRHSQKRVGNIHVFFSHLAITDQSAQQPCVAGKYHVWLNGYISNYKELAFKYRIETKTESDTEVLAKFIEMHGFERMSELNGFFSIVVHDGADTHFFTDRYGIKQLYRYESNGTTYVCSEVKGLKALFKLEIDQSAVKDWRYSLGVMTENTIYKGVTRVPSLPFNKPEPIEITYENAKTQLKAYLKQSFHRNKTKLKSGVFLSGGVDSGIIAKWSNPEYSFSMDYQDEAFSEYENIKLNSTGTHYTMICNRELADRYAPKALDALDDLKVGSCYTNFALTELASKFCTVLYSGAGGDELFYGYTHRYDKPINQVIKRAESDGQEYDITHEEYDWLFLRGILVVEDRMAGYHCMETRYPFLDNDLVDFVLSLPKEYRYNKRILKDISGLPDKITQGRKRGFSNPFFTNSEWVEFCLNRL